METREKPSPSSGAAKLWLARGLRRGGAGLWAGLARGLAGVSTGACLCPGKRGETSAKEAGWAENAGVCSENPYARAPS